MGGKSEMDHRSYGEPLSSGRELWIQKEKNPPIDLIVAASGSARRQSLLRYAYNGLPIMEIPLGENEPDTTFTRLVVAHKLRLARDIVRERRKGGLIGKNTRIAIIAADTQSGPLDINRNGVSMLKQQSKPSNLVAVQRVFSGFVRASDAGQEPHYTITSSSGVVFEPNTKRNTDFIPSSPLMSIVYLDPEKVRELATPQGFRDYQAEFDRLHQSPAYTEGGLKPVSLMDTAAGLSVPVLTRMGAVTGINETGRYDEGFENEFRGTVSIAATGIDPIVLADISPEASRRALEWPFLQRMKDYALGTAA